MSEQQVASLEHAQRIDLTPIKRDELRDLLEADGAVTSSRQAEELADKMMQDLLAKPQRSIDTTHYSPEVALWIHDEQQRISEIRESRVKNNAERAKNKVLEQAAIERRRAEISSKPFKTEAQKEAEFEAEMQARIAEEDRAKRQAVAAEATLVSSRQKPIGLIGQIRRLFSRKK